MLVWSENHAWRQYCRAVLAQRLSDRLLASRLGGPVANELAVLDRVVKLGVDRALIPGRRSVSRDLGQPVKALTVEIAM
ncbi:hypothetical protein Acsp02_70480 [Actinoplanes sp. NBRC 103695]|nr:hypothetical protein Acsp02_70480 [Actinoplanes sp. NBRC 103695]